MYVPSDSFGGLSPERKAADALRTLFTFIAVKIVLAQLEGSGRGSLASYNATDYQDLTTFLEEVPLRDGDAWLTLLLRRNEMLALRIMEVRAAYSVEDFEWESCKKLAVNDIKNANVKMMRQYATDAFKRAVGTDTSGADTPP
ncbi:hypothetical protein WJX72_010898 [[Myrmecia] bisecta]|uniref:Uncharacterized protein n=1 Tax=[Myrmecia] bisecta TaxID=41462 RepID=A0AAW1PB61_9CHLO